MPKIKKLKVKCTDDTIVGVEYRMGKFVPKVQEWVEKVRAKELEEPIEVPFRSDFLEKIIEWCVLHKNDEPHVESAGDYVLTNISTEDQILMRDKGLLHHGKLYDLMVAANWMNLEALVDTCCKTVAGVMVNKTPDQLRQTFNVRNDTNPDEIEQIRQEMEWLEKRLTNFPS